MSVVPSNEYFKTNEKLTIKMNFFDSFGNEIISHPVGISRDLNIECGSMNPNFVVEKYIAVNNTCVLSPILSSAEFKQSQILIQLYAKVSIPELTEYIIESNPISLKVIQEAHDENPSKPSSIQPTTKKGYSFITIVFSLILVAAGLYLFTLRRKKTEKKKKTFQDEDEEEEYGNFQEINFSANSAFTKVDRN
jgi:cbb3-type cytochrome oxidase subunit 3